MSARAPGVLLIEKSEMWVMAHDILYVRIETHSLKGKTTLIQYYILYFNGLHAHQSICSRYICKYLLKSKCFPCSFTVCFIILL